MSLFRSRRGGNVNREDIEAVVEVLPELLFSHHGLEVAAGCRNDTHIALYGFVASDPLNGFLLKDAEQFYLGGRGDVADFVEKDSSSVGDLKSAFSHGKGSGKRALFVTEQLALDDRLRKRGTVEFHECGVSPVAGLMDRMGGELFSGSTFAAQQDSGVAGCDLFDMPVDHAHGTTVANHVTRLEVIGDMLLELLILLLQEIKTFLCLMSELHRAGDYGADELKESKVGIEQLCRRGQLFHADRPNNGVSHDNRGAQKGDRRAILGPSI